MGSAAVLGLAATFGVVVMVAALDAMIRRPQFTAGLLLGHLVLEFSDLELPFLALGGVSVYIKDLVSVLILSAATARLLRAHRLERVQQALIALAFLVILSLLRGLPVFGLQIAVNESRHWLVFLGTALYFSTVSATPHLLERVGRAWVAAAAALSVLALVRWAVLVAGVSTSPGLLRNPGGTEFSVLQSQEALLVASAVFLLAPAWRPGGKQLHRNLSVVFLAVVVLLQHRTILVALIAGLAYLLWRQPDLGRRLGGVLVVGALVAGALSLVALGRDAAEIQADVTNEQTFTWRFEGWQALLASNGPEGVVESSLGKPFGVGWERRVGRSFVESSPHNMYIETYLRMGVLGVGLLIFILVAAFMRLNDRRFSAGEAARLLAPYVLPPLLFFSAVYGLAYHPEVPVALALGLSVAASLSQRSTVTDSPRLQDYRRSLADAR